MTDWPLEVDLKKPNDWWWLVTIWLAVAALTTSAGEIHTEIGTAAIQILINHCTN